MITIGECERTYVRANGRLKFTDTIDLASDVEKLSNDKQDGSSTK